MIFVAFEPEPVIRDLSVRRGNKNIQPLVKILFDVYPIVEMRYFPQTILAFTITHLIWAVWPTLNWTGTLVAWDASSHLLKAHYWAHQLLLNGHFSGWFPIWHGGFDLIHIYPPLTTYVLGILTLVINSELALRLVMAFGWIGMVPAMAYFLNSFIDDKNIAALGAALIPTIKAYFSVGVYSLYGMGLLANAYGFILTIYFLGRLKRDLSRVDRKTTSLIVSGVVFGAVILTHAFSSYWCALASLILWAGECLFAGERKATLTRRYFFIVGTGVLLSLYWWLPFIITTKTMYWADPNPPYSYRQILDRLFMGFTWRSWVILIAAEAGVFYLAKKRQWVNLAFFLGTGLLTFLIALNTINAFLPFGSIMSSSLTIRFESFFPWILFALTAFACAGLQEWFKNKWTLPLLALSILFFFQIPFVQEHRSYMAVVDNKSTQSLKKAGDYLQKHLRPGEFILSEHNWDSRDVFGGAHFAKQLPLENPKIWDMNGGIHESSKGGSFLWLLSQNFQNPAFLSDQENYLRSRGVRYLLSTVEESKRTLNFLPWLNPVWSGPETAAWNYRKNEPRKDGLALYELKNFNTPFGLNDLADLEYFPPGRYRLKFSKPLSSTVPMQVALNYHPWLQARIGKTPAPTGFDAVNRLTIGPFPETKELEIYYEAPLYKKMLSLLSLGAWLGLMGYWFWRRRRP